MKYYLQLLINPNYEHISAIIRNREKDHMSLDTLGDLISLITTERMKNEGIELIDKVLEGLSEVEYFGINDIEAEIKHNLTTVTNNHFDPPTVDHIETTEFKRLIEEWWKESEKYRNIKKDI
jgi:hypothetical protein